jgi:hypothetical protein
MPGRRPSTVTGVNVWERIQKTPFKGCGRSETPMKYRGFFKKWKS